jgi:hypothetical protein
MYEFEYFKCKKNPYLSSTLSQGKKTVFAKPSFPSPPPPHRAVTENETNGITDCPMILEALKHLFEQFGRKIASKYDVLRLFTRHSYRLLWEGYWVGLPLREAGVE